MPLGLQIMPSWDHCSHSPWYCDLRPKSQGSQVVLRAIASSFYVLVYTLSNHHRQNVYRNCRGTKQIVGVELTF